MSDDDILNESDDDDLSEEALEHAMNILWSVHGFYYLCLQHTSPLLTRPLLRVCLSPLAFGAS